MRSALSTVCALLVFATPASAATVIRIAAATGDSAPGGGTYSGMFITGESVQAARGGAVYFEAYVGNGPGVWLFRYQNGKVTLITQKVGDPLKVGDDGTIAWADGESDGCGISVVAPGSTAVTRTGCRSDARTMDGATSEFTVAGGSVYYIGHYDPSPASHGDDDPSKRDGFGIFEGSTRVAALTYPNGWTGSYSTGIDPRWDGYAPFLFSDGTNVYVQAMTDESVWKVSGGTLLPVVPASVRPGFGSFYAAPDRVLYATSAGVFQVRDGKTENLTDTYGHLFFDNSATVLGHLAANGEPDKLVRVDADGLHTVVGLGSRTIDGWSVVALSTAFATPAADDGTTAVEATIRKGSVTKSAVLAIVDACAVPATVEPFPLDDAELAQVRADQQQEIAGYEQQLASGIKTLQADARAHPRNGARDAKAIAELTHLLELARKAGTRSLSAHTRHAEDVQGVVENSKCSWLDAAKDKLKEAAKGADAAKVKELADRLGDLKDVLNGNAKPGSAEAQKLLEANLVALGEKFGGSAKHGELTGKAITLYKVLTKQMSEKELSATFDKSVTELAKALGGKNAGELTGHIVTLVHVIRGDVSEEKQYDVLKETVSALATRLGLEGLMKIPQVRAAMLGFDLGRAFGDRIAADLKLIATGELKKACLSTLADAQGLTGHFEELDYSKNTRAIVKPPFFFEGYNCAILNDQNLPDYPGHALIEATSPVKTYVFGLITTGGTTTYFDPYY